MPRNPDPEKIKERHSLIVMHLDIARTAILGAINRLHPDAAECLPLPELELPGLGPIGSAADGQLPLTGLPDDPYRIVAHEVFLNLFTSDGNQHAAWWRADHPDTCDHMDHTAVRAVFELIHKWYVLLAEAHRYRDTASKRAAFEWALGLVQYHLNQLASLPAAQIPVGT